MNRVSTLTIPATALLFFLPLAGCLFAAGTGHENFKNMMQSNVGKSMDDPYVYRNRYRSLLMGTRELPNGNIEEKFNRHPRCPVFFEIDKKARTIVGWRYEGTDHDCVIVP